MTFSSKVSGDITLEIPADSKNLFDGSFERFRQSLPLAERDYLESFVKGESNLWVATLRFLEVSEYELSFYEAGERHQCKYEFLGTYNPASFDAFFAYLADLGFGVYAEFIGDEDYAWEYTCEFGSKEIAQYELKRVSVSRLAELEATEANYEELLEMLAEMREKLQATLGQLDDVKFNAWLDRLMGKAQNG